ncbi:chromatin structure-remodeling complex subunit RSC7 [Recurvomyces mirabilis]|uniref:Chromatin structure-remodeling complex subunit RSC7 n=1 Tax=Recurvomyces mirabilis TaxID=574656 RepID=A0AAE0WWQ9_9PEZI|nr:chromatin structure-remodeling complex subunit RSC7 [Recurvomyces mirabilis]KAK5158970.1 chromatin structure-remodeling complex subunit RSC7 [Recurvomyces mirabilis]
MPFQKGNKYGGKRNRTSGVAQHTPSRRMQYELEEEEVVYDDDGGDVVMDDGDDMEEDVGTPAQDDDEEEDEDGPPTITAMPRRRGRGRGGRAAGRRSMRADRPDYGTPQPLDGDGEEGSESGTPFRRRRGRLDGVSRGRGRGGFRGRRRGPQAEQSRVVVDKDGQTLDVMDDEVQVEDDEEGSTKVDAKGNLQGGREYRVRTFKIIGRDDRLYMLSTEPARCCGFRDSYLFFAKHPKLYKVLLGEDEKKDLIDRDILPSSYKGRNIGVVTARSVFREFGARIVVAGKRIIDDYKVTEARENGDVEGELADPEDRIPDDKKEYDRNRYVAWFGASEVYRNLGQGAAPGKPGLTGKRRTNLTYSNWQFMHAREASRFNSAISAVRKANLDGVYDTHTNMMFYPKIMQPTHAKWEPVPTEETHASTRITTSGLTNGYYHTFGQIEKDAMDVEEIPRSADPPQHTIFSNVPPIIGRNFAVVDMHYTASPFTSAGYPGPDGSSLDPQSGSNGLSGIPDDLIDELPEDCRRAFFETRKLETQWQRRWGSEAQSAWRKDLNIGLNGYPV